MLSLCLPRNIERLSGCGRNNENINVQYFTKNESYPALAAIVNCKNRRETRRQTPKNGGRNQIFKNGSQREKYNFQYERKQKNFIPKMRLNLADLGILRT